ncbi:MAG: histone deacetylase [Verrucomicrobiales bacterium]|nr:histone deacetylase [Verrucomicrobiales bacterium]
MLPIWYSPIYTEGLDPKARFPRERYRLVQERLAAATVSGGISFRRPCPVSREDLLLAHAPDYVDNFIKGQLDEAVVRRIGLRPWTEVIVERTLILTGGTVEATAWAIENHGFAANLGGGTHHAYYDFGSGYCIFNDLAVAARVAQRDFGIGSVLILDLDVHQGDGTAAIFENDDSVTTVSFHCEKNFPFRKMTSDFDVPLEEGTDDVTYLDKLVCFLRRELSPMDIDFIYFQAGVDPLASDRLGHLTLSREGLMERNQLIFDFARAKDAPLVITMGGGYSDPIDPSVEAHADLFLQAAAEMK